MTEEEVPRKLLLGIRLRACCWTRVFIAQYLAYGLQARGTGLFIVRCMSKALAYMHSYCNG